MMVFTLENDGPRMKTTRDWQAQAKGIIRAELKRRSLSYADLAERLTAIGVKTLQLETGGCAYIQGNF
jgi:hypothetical protein